MTPLKEARRENMKFGKTYLLDTNICIYFLNRRHENLTRRFKAVSPEQIAVCSLVKAELFYGAMKSGNPLKNMNVLCEFLSRFHSFPFDDSAAEAYGRIRSGLEKAGTLIGPNDLCIAAVAVANDLPLVTHNKREFGRVEGLKFEDWIIPSGRQEQIFLPPS